jgi:hypothetical protein
MEAFMYQKEIIYLGLYKDGDRLGSAGFLKVEKRDKDAIMSLVVKNVPHSINGKYPVRYYSGSDWKEEDGITVRQGSGQWEKQEPDSLEKVRLQIMLPGGYLVEGVGKEAIRQTSAANEKAKAERLPDVESVVSQTTQSGVGESERDTQKIAVFRGEQSVAAASNASMREGAAAVASNASMREEAAAVASNASMREEAAAVASNASMREEAAAVASNASMREESAAAEPAVAMSERSVAVDAAGQHVAAGRDASMLEPVTLQAQPKKIERVPIQRRESRENSVVPEQPQMPLMADAFVIEGLKEDKWEQILDTFDNIHPYGDERAYVKLEPKDFIILSGKYQHLVNNSFLLHGFYNYRHIILGKEGEVYYLGVPGVFYEREKMVALMFGFEAFECESGESKAGEFGYYLRKVEL